MLRILGVLVLLMAPLVAQSQTRADALAAALEARGAGDWTAAIAQGRLSGPEGADVIEWYRLRAGEGSFRETQAFLARRPDWPGLKLLRKRSEKTISEQAARGDILSFFQGELPQTGNGALRLADALTAAGQGQAANAQLITAWTQFAMTSEEQAAFLARHTAVVAPYHAARANALMWSGNVSSAHRMLPHLSSGQRALTEARLALRGDMGGFDALIAAVPAALKDHPGLAYERFLWRANKGRTDDATTLMEARSSSREALGKPEEWANLRRRYARQLMRAGDDQRAYQLAARHWLTEGSNFADLEWLAGFIALRKLGDPDTALRHFERFATAVATPISLGRAGYWQGRAHEAAGNTAAANADYARGAKHQTAFYGLLAAERIGAAMDPALTGREVFPDWRSADFTTSSVYTTARLLLEAGNLSLAERFLTHLAESLDRTQIGQMAAMAEELGQPHLQVMIAKRAVQYGMVLERAYFPLSPLLQRDLPVAPELALAIARRESEFDPSVISGVGARGLMQLMPATAEEVAGQLGLPYSGDRLLTDPVYNSTLGAAYLATIQRQFGPSPVQIAAAYNAGPSRPIRWMNERGDPRTGAVDVIDWIEHIQFRETRNYVMRVTESLPIYRARLSGKTEVIRFMQELIGVASTLRPKVRPVFAPATE